MANRIQKIQEEVKNETGSMAEAALRFTISFPAVTTVIPGMRKEKNVLHNVASVEKGSLSAETLKKLSAHRWIRNFYL